MHWTVALLLCICTACLVLNAVQWRMVGTVRVSGMLVCAFWGAQELYWWLTKADSLLLFLTCDLALVAWFWRRGAATGGVSIVSAGGETDASLRVAANGAGTIQVGTATNKVGFFAGAGALKQTVTGAKGSNAALGSLLAALAAYGIVVDSSTA